MIPFQLIFMYGVRVWLYSFACGYLVVPASLVKTIYYPLNCLDTLVKNQLIINVRVFFWASNYVFLLYMSVLVAVLTTVAFY